MHRPRQCPGLSTSLPQWRWGDGRSGSGTLGAPSDLPGVLVCQISGARVLPRTSLLFLLVSPSPGRTSGRVSAQPGPPRPWSALNPAHRPGPATVGGTLGAGTQGRAPGRNQDLREGPGEADPRLPAPAPPVPVPRSPARAPKPKSLGASRWRPNKTLPRNLSNAQGPGYRGGPDVRSRGCAARVSSPAAPTREPRGVRTSGPPSPPSPAPLPGDQEGRSGVVTGRTRDRASRAFSPAQALLALEPLSVCWVST